MIPPLEPTIFDLDQQVLPWSEVGHQATWAELEKVFGYSAHRRARLFLARARLEALVAEGIPVHTLWINGSFVTGADKPNDIDILVVIDGLALPSLWDQFGGVIKFGERMHALAKERYEPGGTKIEHLTDFHYLTYYPPGTASSAVTEGLLDEWHRNWSRLRLPSPKSGQPGKLVEDVKGFVEVRWSRE